jgi:hypothetical protein
MSRAMRQAIAARLSWWSQLGADRLFYRWAVCGRAVPLSDTPYSPDDRDTAAAAHHQAPLTPGIPKLRETDARELLLGPRLRIQKERE